MPGPVLAVTVRYSARNGIKSGPLIILGHGLLELALIGILLAGLGSVFRLPAFIRVVSAVGGLVLIWMAISGWRQSAGKADGTSAEKRRSKLVMVGAGIATSASNPYWLIWWSTVGMAYLALAWRYRWWGLTVFFAGHILADLSWYSLVSWGTARGGRRLSGTFQSGLLKGCSLFLLLLGIFFLARATGGLE